jgi:hypothetical protein
MVHAAMLTALLDDQTDNRLRLGGQWIALGFACLVAVLASYMFPRYQRRSASRCSARCH